MAERFQRRIRVAEKLRFLATAPPWVLASLPEPFYRSTIDDLQKLSYAFLDEKHWMEAGDHLTQALVMYDLLKKAGFQKKDDSRKEESILLLRSACGLKLGAYEVSLKDSKHVLNGDPDNRYAQEIKVLVECELNLSYYNEGQPHVIEKLKDCRQSINKLSSKPFQWDRAHFERVTKRLDDILAIKLAPQKPSMSWASVCKEAPHMSTTPGKDQATVDSKWLPKQGLPKQAKTQPPKPAKQKKKSRSRRQNRPRSKEAQSSSAYVGNDDDYDKDDGTETETETENESEVENSFSTSSSGGSTQKASDVAGLDDFGISSPVSKTQTATTPKKPQIDLDSIEDFGYKTPSRKQQPPQTKINKPKVPQNNSPRSVSANGAVPKTTGPPLMQTVPPLMQTVPPLMQTVPPALIGQPPPSIRQPPPSIRQPPPPVSPESQAWLSGHDFRLACQKCYYQVPQQFGLYSFRLLQDPNHKPQCDGTMLLCRLHVVPRNGLKEVFGRIRPRTKQDFMGKYTLCQQFLNGIPCKISTESCWFPHSNEELEVWEADRKGLFNGREVVSYLRHRLNQQIAEMERQQHIVSQAKAGAMPNKAVASKVQPPGAFPHKPANLSNAGHPPLSNKPAAPAPVINKNTSSHPQGGTNGSYVDGVVRETITNFIKNLGGQFLYLCRLCFDDAPQVLSVQNPSNPSKCTGEKAHPWNAPTRCLVHRLCEGSRERYWKVRKRPNGIPAKAFLCWHRNKNYGCPTGSKCHFAHNEIEVCVWLFEAYHPLNREHLVSVSHELTYGPRQQQAPRTTSQSAPPAPTPATRPSQPVLPQPPARPVFQYNIKIMCGLCYTKTKKLVERDPRRPTQCAGSGHQWGKDLVYFLESSRQQRWIRVLGRHPRLRPEIEPVLCRRMAQCQFREVFSNQCMFPHSDEERLLWIYQVKARAKTIEEVVAIQQQAAARKQGNAGGDATAAGMRPAAGPQPAATHFPQPIVTSRYLCSYCDRPFPTQQHYDRHISSMEHKMRIKSDTERSWKHRSPPLSVTDGAYLLCQRNLKGQCNFSGVVPERNDCPQAHSLEELEEWKERHEYRMMKIAKAKEQRLYSFVDELLAEYNQSSRAEHEVMTEEIPGISSKCSQSMKTVLPIKERKHGEEITFHWDFEVQSVRKSLRRVGLLYDEHRLHFHLSQPEDEDRPQVCPGGLIVELGGTSYKITINFRTHILGLFHQWVVFDFGEKPVLVRKLSIHIGSSSDLERFAKQQRTREKIKLWDSGNSQIIKFTSPSCEPELHEWEKTLVAEYKQPSTLTGLEDEEVDRRMNEENYKLHMHRMLNLEELECMDRLTRYCTATEMTVSTQVELSYPYGTHYAQHGELYGAIKLELPLYDDSEASQIVQQKVSRVLIKFNQESDIVYETLILKNTMAEDQSNDVVCVQLSKKCVDEVDLVSFIHFPGVGSGEPKRVPVIVQFQLDRLSFVYMHHAVDNLSCMTVLFPPHPQRERFQNVTWREVESREEKMNPRQEKAARYICSAGGLRGQSSFRGKGPVIIFGPFGTGKTYTMANSIKRTLILRNDSRILICTHSNSAADLYITEHLDKFCTEFPNLVRMVRMYALLRQKTTINKIVMKYVLWDEAGNLRHPYDSELNEWANFAKTQKQGSSSPNIVIATLNTAVHLTRNHDLREYFTHIIIDEAGQALEPEAIIPLQLATNDTCVVLAGDHKQISPKVYSARARKAKFDVSLLKRLFTYSRDKWCRYDLLLTFNYRTCEEILDFLAESYYHARLEARGNHPRHPLFYPLNFYVVKGEDRLVGTSYVNNQEMLEVVFRVEDLYRHWPQAWGDQDEEGIAVLTPYTLQVHLIRKELRRRGLGHITVDTVQNVQGKQFRAVIISTVRTRETVNKAHITAIPQVIGNQQENEFYYAFLSDERLLNTAFTRAKSLIIVVGDPVALCSVGGCHMTWVRYLQECQKNKSIVPPETTMEMIQEEIAAAKQRLNPAAATFHPRKTTSVPTPQRASSVAKPLTATLPWNQGNSIWSKSASKVKHGAAGISSAYQRLNSEDFPELPELSNGHSQDVESEEEDEFEDVEESIQDDDLLEELRVQVKKDYQEVIGSKRLEDSIEEELQDSPLDLPPKEVTPHVLRRDEPISKVGYQSEGPSDKKQGHQKKMSEPKQPQPAVPQEQKPQLPRHQQRQPEQPPAAAARQSHVSLDAEPNLNLLQDNDRPQFRMVERDGHVALLPRRARQSSLSQVEDYDSDEDEACGLPEEQTEDEFLEKTMTNPDKFKICTFRYDINGSTYAIPVDRQASEIISITSKKRRGQALDNDEVVMEIIKNTEEPEKLEGVEDDVSKEEDNKIYGKVVHILKRDSEPYLRKLVCTLDPFNDNLMVPVDRTFPKLYIVKSQDKTEEGRDRNVAKVTIHTISREAAKTQGRYKPERDIYVTNKDRPHKLFVVRFWKWYAKTPYPMGVVIEELQVGTTAKQGLHILKLVHGVKDKFKVTVDEYLQKRFPPGWSIPKTVLDQRVDFRHKKIFTIDPQDSEDLDDAVSIEVKGNCYEIGIHISDVSFFIAKGSELDEEARIRATSFYPSFHEKPIHMLPKRLSTELCSLLPGKDRLTLSLIVTLDSEGKRIHAPNVYRAVIRSCHKLSYRQAEQIIHGESPPDLEELAEPICQLHKLASKMRSARLGDKKYIFNAEDDDGEVHDPLAHSLIEEFMILANEIVADHLLLKYADCTPLRRQLKPDEDKVEEWRKTHKDGARNSIWLTASIPQTDEEIAADEDDGDEPTVPLSKEVWKEIVQASDDGNQLDLEKLTNLICIDANHPLQSVALKNYHRLMERSEYVNSGDQIDPAMRSHFSLQLKAYVHFTSPIRRYIDLVVHRLLTASLEGVSCPYEARELSNITHTCTSRAIHSQRFSVESRNLQLALKLQEAPLQLLTFIENFSDSGLRLLFPHRPYIHPLQRNMAFNILKPSSRPDTSPASQSADLTWKSRIYDVRQSGRERIGHRRDAIELDRTRFVVHVPEDNWEDIQNSVKMGDCNDVKRAIKSAIDSGGPELNQYADVMSQFSDRSEHSSVEVSCEYISRAGKQQNFISFARSFRRGDVDRVQMHARLFKGVLTPHIHLFSLTPQFDICAEHRNQPIQCFSDIATKIPGREKSIAAYKKAWLPVLSMVSAYGAVNNDDTITIHNVSITWQKMEHDRYQGYFNLAIPFTDQRFISFLSRQDDKKQNEEDEIQLDFLCIRYQHLPVSSRKLLKMREFNSRSQYEETIGPFNRTAWAEQTFVAHGYTTHVQLDRKANLVTITFQLHTTSLPFPEELLYQPEDKKKTCTIELIPKSEPDKCLENAVCKLPESTPLIRSICLQKSCKPSDDVFSNDPITKVILKEGAKLKDLRVPESELKPLNNSQQQAVKMALTNNFSAIQGPPGTGKTVTGAYLAYFYTLINQRVPAMGKGRPQVLYCGPSNKAVDVIATYLKKFDRKKRDGSASDKFMVRVYSKMMENKVYPIPGMPSLQSKWKRTNEAKVDDRLDDVALHKLIRRPDAPYAEQIREMELRLHSQETVTLSEVKAYKKLIEEAEEKELKEHSIVLCTCTAAGAKRVRKYTNIIQCIVDEAGMCNEPETLIPFTNTLPHQIVLIGDHKQLRPIITEPNARDLGMEESLLQKYSRKARMLTIQYRMHEAICSFPSENFYNGKLVTDATVKRRSPDPLRAIWPNRGHTPMVFCHLFGKEETLTVKSDEGNEMSKGNKAEVHHATRITNQLLRKGARPSDIVILSQYKLQCTLIEERLKESGHNRIKVSTVVTSQGSEWEYVILSLVRSMPKIEIDEKPSRGWQRKHLGFITDENQMNVALTRAKRGLIIIGNKHLMETHTKWKELLKKYADLNCVVEARDFPPFTQEFGKV